MKWLTARIVRKSSGLCIFPIITNGLSYHVPGCKFTTKRGQVRAVYGCKNEREAFAVAKQLRRKAGEDVSQWKLVLLPSPNELWID